MVVKTGISPTSGPRVWPTISLTFAQASTRWKPGRIEKNIDRNTNRHFEGQAMR